MVSIVQNKRVQFIIIDVGLQAHPLDLHPRVGCRMLQSAAGDGGRVCHLNESPQTIRDVNLRRQGRVDIEWLGDGASRRNNNCIADKSVSLATTVPRATNRYVPPLIVSAS